MVTRAWRQVGGRRHPTSHTDSWEVFECKSIGVRIALMKSRLLHRFTLCPSANLNPRVFCNHILPIIMTPISTLSYPPTGILEPLVSFTCSTVVLLSKRRMYEVSVCLTCSPYRDIYTTFQSTAARHTFSTRTGAETADMGSVERCERCLRHNMRDCSRCRCKRMLLMTLLFMVVAGGGFLGDAKWLCVRSLYVD